MFTPAPGRAAASPHTRFIPREELRSFAAWTPGSFGDGAPGHGLRAPEAPAPAASVPDEQQWLQRVAEARREGAQEGYQNGYRDGLVALESFKQNFAAQTTSQVGALLQAMQREFETLQPRLAEGVARVALELARQVLRHELRTQPEVVSGVAAQAVQALVHSAGHVQLQVHPQDVALVREGAAEQLASRAALVTANPALKRGDCIIESDVGTLDARIATRWAQATANLAASTPWTDAEDTHDGGRNLRAGRRRRGARGQKWNRYLDELHEFAAVRTPFESTGRLVRVTGLVLEAVGLCVPVGSMCEIVTPTHRALAEVVGFNGERAFLMPTADVQGLASGCAVVPRPAPSVMPRWGEPHHPWRRREDRSLHLPMGEGLLGRVIDAHGVPLDRAGPLERAPTAPMGRRPINAMDRDPVRTPLDTGVRAINTLLTVGRGQRLGLFAGTGVGKSVLLGMMARFTAADVIVVGLIGERGREVKEFIEDILGTEGLKRSVVVAAPADVPPLVRLQGASYAAAIAEHFRDQGRHVLLLMDSLTRFAMAQREIALAIGEPPATKGYPPSCFAKLPQLVERSGNGLNGVGSITAFYTVLTEGDDPQDPIADAARGILDGHIVLSRELAEGGHFPAIDIERSISRVMNAVAGGEHIAAARRVRQWQARLSKARDLIQLGAYTPGADPELDTAVRLQPQITQLLQQDMKQSAPLATSRAALINLTQQA